MDISIYDHMSVLGDAVRSRLLVLLEEGELAVLELVRILQLPQSTVSRHLKALADGGWVSSRTSGRQRFYRLSTDLEEDARGLWDLVRKEAKTTISSADRERALAVRAERRAKTRAFFASQAGRWDALREQLFGGDAEVLPLLGLLGRDWTVGDLGAGTGAFSALVSPHVEHVIAVDASPEMLEAAGERLSGVRNVGLRLGELESLPIESETLDLGVMLLVLHLISEPQQALAEAARALKPGSRLVVVDMRAHERDTYVEDMGHQWPGFGAGQLEGWIRAVGLGSFQHSPLRPRSDAGGPLLFVAAASKPTP